MGIKGLMPRLKVYMEDAHLRDLENCFVVIGSNSRIYSGARCCARDLALEIARKRVVSIGYGGRYIGWRRSPRRNSYMGHIFKWDGYDIANRDREEREYEMEQDNEGRCELLDDHELSDCDIRRFKMVKYSFRDDEKYVAIKEDESDDLTSTSKDACRAYQEIFRKMDEGWIVTRDELRKMKKKSNLNTSLVMYKVVDIANCLVKVCKVWDEYEVDRYGNSNLVIDTLLTTKLPSDQGEHLQKNDEKSYAKGNQGTEQPPSASEKPPTTETASQMPRFEISKEIHSPTPLSSVMPLNIKPLTLPADNISLNQDSSISPKHNDKAQAEKIAEYEAKRAKMFAEYNHYITYRADKRPIIKINNRIDRDSVNGLKCVLWRPKQKGKAIDTLLKNLKAKFEWIKTQAGKLGLPSPPELSTFGLSAAEKKRKRTSELLKEGGTQEAEEIMKKLEFTIEARNDVEHARKIAKYRRPAECKASSGNEDPLKYKASAGNEDLLSAKHQRVSKDSLSAKPQRATSDVFKSKTLLRKSKIT
nr:hypothetical protein [Tanacetum cinerariifolium]